MPLFSDFPTKCKQFQTVFSPRGVPKIKVETVVKDETFILETLQAPQNDQMRPPVLKTLLRPLKRIPKARKIVYRAPFQHTPRA